MRATYVTQSFPRHAHETFGYGRCEKMTIRKLLFFVTSMAIAIALVFFHSTSAMPQPNPEQPDLTISAATRREVIEAVTKTLDDYVFPIVAKEVQTNIRTRWQNGEYNSITSAIKFAQTLTDNIQAISLDKHLRVFYSHKPFPPTNKQGEQTDIKEREKFQQSLAWENFGFHKVERLAGNIGYLDIRAFMPQKQAGEIAIAAMNFLSNTRALIIDLRQNGGGSPDMVALISTYLFDDKLVHLNDLHWREKDASGKYRDRIEQHWTLPYVPGERYLNKDVYILTSKDTFWAAEEFANNLQQLKRATIIGEITLMRRKSRSVSTLQQTLRYVHSHRSCSQSNY